MKNLRNKNRSRPYFRAVAVLLGFVTVLLVSCARNPAPEKGLDAGLSREYERGPVKVVLSLDRREPTIADRINLTITVTAQEDYDIQLPRFGDKLEQFGIVDYHTSQPRLIEDGRTMVSRSYILEPFLSGDYTIPPMKVGFSKRGETDPKQHDIETDEIAITVKSILPEKLGALKINEVVDPVALPRSVAPLAWIAMSVAVLLAVVCVAVIVHRRRRAVDATVVKVPAHVIALRELEELVADDLTGRGKIKQFYLRISGILRHYIEDRFGLRAPEQTTEEFLFSLGGSSGFPVEYRSLLDTFLNHCDQVKFAELQPATEDIQRTFDSCKAFIIGTAQGEVFASSTDDRSGKGVRKAENSVRAL